MSSGPREYDRIGGAYGVTRRTDPRIAAVVVRALGDAASVLNVGAGTGSYEPDDRRVVALDPSRTMLVQRPPGSAPAVQGVAEALPFRDGAFDAVMGILTIHHWADWRRGLAEARRVARRRVVLLISDQDVWERFWLLQDYLPALIELDRARFVPISDILRALGGARVEPVPIPRDCRDGFTGAFWARPEAYLEPRVRAGMSPFGVLSPDRTADGLRRLAADLASGEWDRRYGHLRTADDHDLGYRLVIAELGKSVAP
ncbi:MAG: class I SAM-dependent methyltransferase [Actinomycetota bacterium]|nr:class I SAM-dependent methyltransferase [Actinomycetota bacterium]